MENLIFGNEKSSEPINWPKKNTATRSSPPAPEGPKHRTLRRQVVLAFAVVVFVLGLPMWYLTTRVYRAELPSARVYDLQALFAENLRFEVPVYLDLSNAQQDLVVKAQRLIDEELLQSHPEGLPWSIKLSRGKGTERDYRLTLKRVRESEGVYVSPYSREVDLYLSDAVVTEGKVAELILKVVVRDLFGGEIAKFHQLHSGTGRAELTVAPYTPAYHLSFSLLYEGGEPVRWEIEQTWNRYMKSFLRELQPFANFTVDSQIQYHSVLAQYPAFNVTENAYILTENDLSTFVNYGDWNLVSATAKPTLNFLLYVPSTHRPMQIQDSLTNTFIVPRWGAVKLLNKDMLADSTLSMDELIPIMETFTSSLLHLLGAPESPSAPKIRIDTLMRTAIYQNLHKSVDNMFSLLKLVEKLAGISIPPITLTRMLHAITAVEHSLDSLKRADWVAASRWAGEALVASDQAFFEENMVQQMYFPDEHKFAVYMPLCGPVLMVTLLGVVRVIKELREKRKTL